jgi:ribonuclease VapC
MWARYGPAGRTMLERVRGEFSIEIIGYTAAHADIAMYAFARFGRGRHPAALNFGDCMTYAVASLQRDQLLAVGDDFRRTELRFEPNDIVGYWV